jgi:hypothetical protein
MSMGWDYVSELLVTTGLMLIRQEIYEHGEQFRSDINRWNSWFINYSCLTRLPEYTSSSKAGGTSEGNDKFCLTQYLFRASNRYLVGLCQKSLRHGTYCFIPLWRKPFYWFLSLLKIHRPRPCFNPRMLAPISIKLTTMPSRTTDACMSSTLCFVLPAHLFSLLHCGSKHLWNIS